MSEASSQNICNRSFKWVSSVTGDPKVLSALSQEMMRFYSQSDDRKSYQEMLDTQEDLTLESESVRHLMPMYVCESNASSILEVGCGNGRVYRQIRDYGYAGLYTGVEPAEFIISQNKERHPEAGWECAGVYEMPFQDNTFELCYSLYVLEHLVYPEKALREMLRVLRPGGRLVLVFPDFAESGRFASQLLGLSPINTATKKLRSGRIVDALLSLYDSRIRLPRALKSATQKHGKFPVNIAPLCLSYPTMLEADVDAVYIASKSEVHEWAISNGHSVEYPCGSDGEFSEHAFMVINKDS
jgi:ubiquinone/menaquinone biosynthesis C-methylase UbiE